MKWNAEFAEGGWKFTSNLKPYVDQSTCGFERCRRPIVVVNALYGWVPFSEVGDLRANKKEDRIAVRPKSAGRPNKRSQYDIRKKRSENPWSHAVRYNLSSSPSPSKNFWCTVIVALDEHWRPDLDTQKDAISSLAASSGVVSDLKAMCFPWRS